ncbi:endonuclease/exonuclease/phosphatase family protein [Methylosarcina fibrata]|uniref:endonuclease/exonuclease/phosphatase family protein n=1 Tax=Methylosarcina fibrata TaxID=105972 RepID=UPI000362D685|nr:endonuclease/exonuclease/phosphatase family protein [Methylosarcina fibrata]
MDKIQLIYVKNVITRKKRGVRQLLSFFMLLENLSPHKEVDVLWAGEDGIWHTLAAAYHSACEPGREYWRAETELQPTSDHSLPGNIQFALRYRTLGKEYWDNNLGRNHSSEADSGIEAFDHRRVLNIDFSDRLDERRKYVPVCVAVDRSLHAEKVTVHWTTDNWRHTRKTACHFKRNYWDKEFQSNARNPNQYGVELWKGWVKIADAFRLQYSISCESRGQILWDNNHGRNYSASRRPLNVMILNLHCYQEENQEFKFNQIAKAINELDVDIACFQEVAELWNDGNGDWQSNSARIINELLEQPYHLYTDWSHLGFNRYREGVAILSRYPMTKQESRYVSDSHDVYDIHARKVVMAQIHLPYMGTVNVFSAHLSWWEDGFAEQFHRLRRWAAERHRGHLAGTLLCGDFNVTAGSEGYHLVVDTHEYDDQFLAANAQGVFEKIFRVNDSHWQNHLADDYRIDYIFLNKASDLSVTSGRVLFTDEDYGRVSDHCGYLMTFVPKV